MVTGSEGLAGDARIFFHVHILQRPVNTHELKTGELAVQRTRALISKALLLQHWTTLIEHLEDLLRYLDPTGLGYPLRTEQFPIHTARGGSLEREQAGIALKHRWK